MTCTLEHKKAQHTLSCTKVQKKMHFGKVVPKTYFDWILYESSKLIKFLHSISMRIKVDAFHQKNISNNLTLWPWSPESQFGACSRRGCRFDFKWCLLYYLYELKNKEANKQNKIDWKFPGERVSVPLKHVHHSW